MLNTKPNHDNSVYPALLLSDFFKRFDKSTYVSEVNNGNFTDNLVWFDLYKENNPFTSTELNDEYNYIILEIISEDSSFNIVGVNRMNSLDNYYQINDPGVSEFAERNHLVSFLIEAAKEIKKVFGNNTIIELEKVIDPEIEDDITLFAYIQTNLSVDEALSKIDKIEDNWFIENLHRAKGRFNFDVKWV